MRTYKELIRNDSDRYQIHTIDFVLRFDIPISPDPMRFWTVNVNGRRAITCGAGLLLSEKLIKIYKREQTKLDKIAGIPDVLVKWGCKN